MKSGEGDEIFGVLCILLAIACCFDYKTHRIPNWLIVCCMFAGLGYRLISGGYKGVLEYLASALLTTILLYFVFWIGAIGAGDVKMLGVCAGFFPWNKVLYFLFFALMIAAVIALFKMYLERNMKDRLYYLGEYLWDVFRCGRWKLYFAGEREGAGDLHGGTGVLQCIDVYGRNVLMEQKEPVLVLYDREEEYARLFSEYLKRQKELPWQIHTYTRAEELLAGEKSGEVTMLVVAESSCEEALNTLQPTCQAILNESGTLRFHQFPNINKYQEAGQVWKELLALYVETTGIRMPLLCAEYKTRFIGMYSPVHRCLQSTFALSFAQLMAEKHPTLYLNFEHYVGIIELLPERQDRDLADLLYFLAGDEGKFPLRMQTVIQRKGNLDYIPPMRNGQNLLGITWEEWRSLFQRIEELGKYEYVILDLSESIQGLLDVLQMCIKVFTLTREDKMSQCKLDQYEQLLSLCEKEEVKGKTRKLNLPYFQRLPVEMEQYTRGELADYVRKEIETLEE